MPTDDFDIALLGNNRDPRAARTDVSFFDVIVQPS